MLRLFIPLDRVRSALEAAAIRAVSRRIVLGLLLVAVGAAPVVPLVQGAPARELEVPHPDLSAMESLAREKVETMQRTLDRLLGAPGTEKLELAEAFGYLGQLYHAFSFPDAAIDCYTIAATLATGDVRWRYLRGLAKNAKGDFEAAIEDYERALEVRPEDVAARVRLGNALLELGDAERAERQFRELVSSDEAKAAALYGLGRVAVAAGDLETAVRYFEETLQLQPGASVVHYPLGQAYRRLGDVERAREQLTQRGQEVVFFPDSLGGQVEGLAKGTAFEVVLALARDRENFSEEDFLGFALSQLGDLRGAIEQLQYGLNVAAAPTPAEGSEQALAPTERARIHYVLGGLLVNAGRDAEAVEQFSQALALSPLLYDAQIKRGNAWARLGSFDEAVADYSAVLEERPDDTTALLKRAAALTELDQATAASSDLKLLRAIEPDNSEGAIRLAALSEAEGDVDGAIALFMSALELDLTPEERTSTHLRLARLLRTEGRAEEALEQYRRAVEATPDSVPAVDGLASLLAQLGRYGEAARHYGILVSLDPHRSGHRLAEITALILDRQFEAARQRLEAGMAILPDDLALKDLAARHLAACPERSVRDGARAVEIALELYDKVPTVESMETLAMAYAEAGRFEEAVSWQQRAIEKLGEAAPADRLQLLTSHLDLFQNHQPCCGEQR